MKPYERKQLLERIEREGATVGTRVPEEIEVQGETLSLRRLVFEARSHETVPAELRDRLETTKRDLRRERLERKNRIEDGEITRAEGEQLVSSVVGIDRALNALSSLSGSVDAEADRQETADQKRWMNFLRQALGRESGGRR